MKYLTFFKQSIFAFFAVFFLNSLAIANDQGVITYNIIYDESEISQQMKNNMPEKVTLSFNANKIRMDFSVKSGVEMANITDPDNRLFVIMMTMGPHKMAFKLVNDEIDLQSEKYGITNIRFLDETKTIAGYLCKKAIISYEEDEDLIVYYTEEIDAGSDNYATPFEGIPGVLMQFSMLQKNVRVTFVAEKVEFQTVDNSMFVIPQGYQIISGEDALQQLQFGR